MSYYDEIEIEDMEFNEEDGSYNYPCPCGDLFIITLEQLQNAEEIGRCPSCSLIIRVIYDPEDFKDLGGDEEDVPPSENALVEVNA
ncbi:DPH3 [Acrasis kona]|uniref:Diphthamide biosynthesis protein 3 n=1 Tax=Acrasis kona TaxID=1008807 RepID=A0AAW2Z4Z3_9EUKA